MMSTNMHIYIMHILLYICPAVTLICYKTPNTHRQYEILYGKSGPMYRSFPENQPNTSLLVLLLGYGEKQDSLQTARR